MLAYLPRVTAGYPDVGMTLENRYLSGDECAKERKKARMQAASQR
jgi:hypothetical protein